MEHKFKVGDRVCVTKIDNQTYYSDAPYKIGDIGTITFCGQALSYGTNDYLIVFDRLKADGKDPKWCALEHWLELENPLIVCE